MLIIAIADWLCVWRFSNISFDFPFFLIPSGENQKKREISPIRTGSEFIKILVAMLRYSLVSWPESQRVLYSEDKDCFKVYDDGIGPAAFVQDPHGDFLLVGMPEAQLVQYKKGTYEIYDTDEEDNDGDYLGTMAPVKMYAKARKAELVGIDIRKAAARLVHEFWLLRCYTPANGIKDEFYTFERGGRSPIALYTKNDKEKGTDVVVFVKGKVMDFLP